MPSKTSLPIARLRSFGCKVSTVVGHDPAIGDFIYRVTIPDTPAGDGAFMEAQQQRGLAQGYATMKFRQVTVRSTIDRIVAPVACDELRERAEADVAGLLNAMADVLGKTTRR